MTGMFDLEETARRARHHRQSPYDLDVTGQLESCVTIHGQLVEMAGPADQTSVNTETIPAVPPWMEGRLKDHLDTGNGKD